MDIPTLSPAVVDALSDSHRRAVLSVLFDREGAVSVGDLAQTIAVWETPVATNGHPVDWESVQSSLRHRHLPMLANADAVVYDPETDYVKGPADPPFDSEWVLTLVDAHPEPAYDDLLRALTSARRQAVLYVVLTADGPVAVDALAVEVAAHERECPPAAVPAARRQATRLTLHHTHLPQLADVDLVTCDGSERVRVGDRQLHAEAWVAASPIGDWAARE